MSNYPGIFNSSGVIHPVHPNESGVSEFRSPYPITGEDLVNLFAFTPERISILNGFFAYRAEIYKTGINSGFQWLNGSFATYIEMLDQRPPNDIDVVTFFDVPNGETQLSLGQQHPNVFIPQLVKPKFFVDGYWIELGQAMSESSIQKITYWYSMWSHRRGDNMWKGFLQLALSPDDDKIAIKLLKDKEVMCNEC